MEERPGRSERAAASGATLEVGSLPSPELFTAYRARIFESCDERFRESHDAATLDRSLAESFASFRVRKRGALIVRATAGASLSSSDEPRALLEVVMEDQAFIIDTIQLFFDDSGVRVHCSLVLTAAVERDRSGRLLALGAAEAGERREILARFELAATPTPDFLSEIERGVRSRLEIAGEAVRDFKKMKSVLRAVGRSTVPRKKAGGKAASASFAETRDLIEWLLEDNFVLMGVSFIAGAAGGTPATDAARRLGHAFAHDEDDDRAARQSALLGESDDGFASGIAIFKGVEESPIHRAGKLDHVLLRRPAGRGEPEGVLHVRGLFTFQATQTPGAQIPLIRRKLEGLLDRPDAAQNPLLEKSYTSAFNTIPIEFLFEARAEEIAAIAQMILEADKDQEIRTHFFADRGRRRGVFFLAIPRQWYSEELRSRTAGVLEEALRVARAESRVQFGKGEVVLLTFFLFAPAGLADCPPETLAERVRAVVGAWEERFARQLEGTLGADAARDLLERYSRAFPTEYQVLHTPAEALNDVLKLETVRGPRARGIAFEQLYGERDKQQKTARLRIYLRRHVYLSRILPILDNFGLQVIDQTAFRIEPAGQDALFMESFRIAGVEGEGHPLVVRKAAIIEALEVVFARHAPNDLLNRLIADTGLDWRDVDLLRAYGNYLRQLNILQTLAFMSNTYRQNGAITRLLIEYYRVRFDPGLDLAIEQRASDCSRIKERIVAALHAVPSSAQDSFLRQILSLFEATLRTTRFQVKNARNHYIAFKVDPRALRAGSEPKPWREIYVHHHGMEGIHLRGGQLARGGIRWSDRINDSREEVLGLMRTQMVKNVLIVPVGAKGGFIVRRPAAAPDLLARQGEDYYRVFINALLDLTDNHAGGAISHPPGVVCYDKEDPYLVVAADKGTARFSNTANEVAKARGFWLGDAFASGGSNGYDHKALAITARGAWECAQRHFRELGIDVERNAISVAGIGDMGGDVFGNGMLQSRNMRLLAAFNHVHIFIDPAPDPAASYRERERLFRLPRSTWADYDRKVLSAGGGVFGRQDKYIRLSAEACRLLGLEAGDLSPQAVISAILALEVDLLWNGGIGTYIKETNEDNRDVGDFANEGVRINAARVRAKVIIEGGNLGVTQAGRVEFSLRGGCINTDFIDNSGGVDCSDHEVNLKILLAGEVAAARLPIPERNALLQRLSEDVCRAVLRNSRANALMLSLDVMRSRSDLFSFERLIKVLEDRGLVQRDRDELPTLDQLVTRAGGKKGMTRPELALLSACAKMHIKRRLLDVSAASLPRLERYLREYFPAEVVELYGGILTDHLLARQIGVTVLANAIFQHAGACFFFDVERETGAELDQIVRAYHLADEIFACREIRRRVLALDAGVPSEAQYRALLAVEDAVRKTVAWLLSGSERGRLDRIERESREYVSMLAMYERELPEGLSSSERTRFLQVTEQYRAAAFGEELAQKIARVGYATAGLRISDIAHRLGARIADVTKLYFQAGQVTQILPLIRKCDDKFFTGRWETLALRITRNSMLDALWGLTSRLVERLGAGEGDAWVERGLDLLRSRPFFDELKADIARLGSEEELTIATLQVMSSRVQRVQLG